MLSQSAPFPYVGSFALLEDNDSNGCFLPGNRPRATELVRIVMRREGEVVVGFPLRDGASGNKAVPEAKLIDATPLTDVETREFHDLDRQIGRRESRDLSKALRVKAKRRDALKSRLIWSRFMAGKLAEMHDRDARRKAA